MTYYVIKFVWKNYRNFVQTTYAGYDRVDYNWWPSPLRVSIRSRVITLRLLLTGKILPLTFPKSLLTQKM